MRFMELESADEARRIIAVIKLYLLLPSQRLCLAVTDGS